ncbi:MAG: endonuclease/exonuclease/phosphatase family protein [Acidimicrobiia bacterium]|nr:endonuclease/exonuclease/phosphatase family protein [Acidimicrobiia bacterium]
MCSFQPANRDTPHGFWLGAFGCTPDTDNCDAPGRVDVAMRHVEAIGCPDVVTFQEVDTRVARILAQQVPVYCGGAYSIHIARNHVLTLGVEQTAVLSRLPVLEAHLLDLPSFPYIAYHVALDSDLGRVDLVTTHLPASLTNFPCLLAGCPPHCDLDDDNARECAARVVLRHLGTAAPPTSVHIVTGDFNAEPDSVTYGLFLDHFFADSHLVAGNPECDATHRESCTGGGREPPAGLYEPTALDVERIDYIMVRGTAACPVRLDTALDLDGDGTGTGNWANLPIDPPGNGGLVFASDHSGNQADIHCG